MVHCRFFTTCRMSTIPWVSLCWSQHDNFYAHCTGASQVSWNIKRPDQSYKRISSGWPFFGHCTLYSSNCIKSHIGVVSSSRQRCGTPEDWIEFLCWLLLFPLPIRLAFVSGHMAILATESNFLCPHFRHLFVPHPVGGSWRPIGGSLAFPTNTWGDAAKSPNSTRKAPNVKQKIANFYPTLYRTPLPTFLAVATYKEFMSCSKSSLSPFFLSTLTICRRPCTST